MAILTRVTTVHGFMKLMDTTLLTLIVACAAASGAETPSPSEYQVKAVFLYNFAKFVEWPANAFADARAPITIGVLGKDPFGRDLEQAIKGETVKGRKLVIKRFKGDQGLEKCHLLFISSSEEKRLEKILATLKDSSILTVGEVKSFTQLGGIINFTMKEKKVRFEINIDAAERAGLKLSSQLLKLAKIVTEKKHEE